MSNYISSPRRWAKSKEKIIVKASQGLAARRWDECAASPQKKVYRIMFMPDKPNYHIRLLHTQNSSTGACPLPHRDTVCAPLCLHVAARPATRSRPSVISHIQLPQSHTYDHSLQPDWVTCNMLDSGGPFKAASVGSEVDSP